MILKKLDPVFKFIEKRRRALIKCAVLFVLFLLFGPLISYLYHEAKVEFVYSKVKREVARSAQELLVDNDRCDPLRCFDYFEVVEVKKLEKEYTLRNTSEEAVRPSWGVGQNRGKAQTNPDKYPFVTCKPRSGQYVNYYVKGRRYHSIPSFLTYQGTIDLCIHSFSPEF